jgi:hypothetical protein
MPKKTPSAKLHARRRGVTPPSSWRSIGRRILQRNNSRTDWGTSSASIESYAQCLFTLFSPSGSACTETMKQPNIPKSWLNSNLIEPTLNEPQSIRRVAKNGKLFRKDCKELATSTTKSDEIRRQSEPIVDEYRKKSEPLEAEPWVLSDSPLVRLI